jgi:hypothetical protein
MKIVKILSVLELLQNAILISLMFMEISKILENKILEMISIIELIEQKIIQLLIKKAYN